MPHFVIHCSENVLSTHAEEHILQCVHDTAEETGLFKKGDIKVRLQSFKNYIVGNSRKDFIHVFGNIMQGRTVDQRADLSRKIITELKSLFPDVPVVSMNVFEFEKLTYCNRDMI